MITFETISSIDEERLKRNEEYSGSLGFPSLKTFRATGNLAIVGGGLSINQYLYTLQSWQGDVWAINRTWKWCEKNDIKATFFSFDANPSVAEMVDGVEKAILYHRTDVEVYKKLLDKQVWIGNSNVGGSTSTGAALVAGLEANYDTVTLFGCDGCYQFNGSHAYGNWQGTDTLVVWCDNMHFLTNPQMLIASIEIATMMNSVPDLVRECSGGLLRALSRTECRYEIVGYTDSFLKKINPENNADSRANLKAS